MSCHVQAADADVFVGGRQYTHTHTYTHVRHTNEPCTHARAYKQFPPRVRLSSVQASTDGSSIQFPGSHKQRSVVNRGRKRESSNLQQPGPVYSSITMSEKNSCCSTIPERDRERRLEHQQGKSRHDVTGKRSNVGYRQTRRDDGNPKMSTNVLPLRIPRPPSSRTTSARTSPEQTPKKLLCIKTSIHAHISWKHDGEAGSRHRFSLLQKSPLFIPFSRFARRRA